MKKRTIAILSSVAGTVMGISLTTYRAFEKIKRQKELSDKHLMLYRMMNQWVRVKQEEKSIADHLEKNGYKEIAIYGMNYVGETLLNELKGSNIKVKYAIDKKADSIFSEVDVVMPEDELNSVDAVIVTPITFFEEIEELLSEKLDCPILSIEDILYEL